VKSNTKKVRYGPRQRRPAAAPLSPEEALLAKLRKLAAAGKEMTLRALCDEINPAKIHLLAEARPELLSIVGNGREHRVVFRDAGAAAGPPRSGSEPAPPELDEPLIPDEAPSPEPAAAPAKSIPGIPVQAGAPPGSAASGAPAPSERRRGESDEARLVREMRSDEAYNQLLAECKTIGPRRGGRDSGRRRTRHPLVDIETGQSLEIQNSEGEQCIPGIGKKRYGRKYLLQLAKLQAPKLKPAPAQPEPMPPRHRLPQNRGRAIPIV
jgi:hypothetical protein